MPLQSDSLAIPTYYEERRVF